MLAAWRPQDGLLTEGQLISDVAVGPRMASCRGLDLALLFPTDPIHESKGKFERCDKLAGGAAAQAEPGHRLEAPWQRIC